MIVSEQIIADLKEMTICNITHYDLPDFKPDNDDLVIQESEEEILDSTSPQ